IENFENLSEGIYSGKTGVKNEERFNSLISNLLLDNAMMDLDMGHYDTAIEGVEKFLRMLPNSAKGHFCLGEIYRQRGENQDSQKAENEYFQALSYDQNYPLPHKGLGILYYKQGIENKSINEFKKYLELLPDAFDKEYINQYIQHLKAE
ncbi:MAG: hypothetical protein P8X90_36630, partial [Desulfobacterales bacterium]